MTNMMNAKKKNIKCTMCQKLFKTIQSRDEHLAMKHHPQLGQQLQSSARRSRRGGGRPRGGAPMSVGVSIRGQPSPLTRLSGTDILTKIDDISGYVYGSEIFSELIVPGLFPRLALVARTFQKVIYHKITVRIVPQISTTTSGGYVAAFVADPADDTPQGDALVSHLISQRASQAQKWWQNSVINIPLTNTMYFTSRGVDVREYSPGKFLIASTGKPSQVGSLVVYVDWDVSLSVATLERLADVEPNPTLQENLYLKKGSQGLYRMSGSDLVYAKDLLLAYKGYKYFELPYPVFVQDGETQAAANVKACFYMVRNDTSGFTLASSLQDNGMKYNSFSDTLIIKEGTVVSPIVTSVNRQASLLTGQFKEAPMHLPRPSDEQLQGVFKSLMEYPGSWDTFQKEHPTLVLPFVQTLEQLSSSELTESSTLSFPSKMKPLSGLKKLLKRTSSQENL